MVTISIEKVVCRPINYFFINIALEFLVVLSKTLGLQVELIKSSFQNDQNPNMKPMATKLSELDQVNSIKGSI